MTDAQARKFIIEKIDTNIFVEAGAGSGKTTMLVERMVAMVEKGLPVEKICTITFTKAAANEFYERFQKRLIERSRVPETFNGSDHELPKPTEQTAQRCREALENIDLCFMGTIDSFCNMILSEHPSEAGVPSDARLIDDKKEAELYRQFYVDVRAGVYDKKLKDKASVFASLFWDPEEKFALIMKEVMDRRNVNFIYDQNSETDPYLFLKKDRETLIKVLDTFNKDLSKLSLSLGRSDNRDPMEVYLSASATLHKGWHYNYQGAQKALKDISTLVYEASPDELGFINERFVREQDGRTVLNIADEDSKDALIPKLREYKYYNSLSFLLGCVPLLEEKMKNEGQLTFFDYLYYLRNMLQSDAENNEGKLISYINSRHSYYMIDEFQDTNPMQAEVFFHLAAEDPKEPDWKKCKPRPGSLFIVGDPKQSIYRFRSADVSSYIEIKKLFKNGAGEVVSLVNNFRSKNIVKNYFNDVFNELMPEDTRDQSAYQDIENINAKEDSDEFEGIYIYETYNGKLQEEDPEKNDYDQLIKIIKTMVNNPDHQIREKDRSKDNYDQLRNITYKDFMIIFASKKPIAGCIARFNKEEIPLRVEGKVLFEECEALKAITCIYKCVTDTSDVISLIETLYSPVFGLNENDLSVYKQKGNDIRIDLSKEYGDNGIEKALKKLAVTAGEVSTMSASALFEKIIDDYKIYEYVPSERMEIVYYTLELLRGEELSGNIVTFFDASSYLDELLSGESDLERCLSLKEDEDAVHVANLHKVKGLEAPIVILAKAGVKKNEPDIRIDYSDPDGIKAYVIALSETSDSGISYPIIETGQHQKAKEEEKESLKKEGDRLVYVAATRARNVLIINKSLQAGKYKPQASASRWKPLRERLDQNESLIFEKIGDDIHFEKATHEILDPEVLYDSTVVRKIDKDPTYENINPSTLRTPSKIVEEPFEAEGKIEDNEETYSTLIGTMVHALMEAIIMSKDKSEKMKLVENIISQYMKKELSDYEEIFRKKLEKVYDVMHGGGYVQSNGAIKDILPEILNSEEAYCEIPFTYKEGNYIYNGIIDLMYRKDDRLHIIDWKTNRNDEGLSLHYKDQLEAYKKAVKQLTGEDVEDALIYHISL